MDFHGSRLCGEAYSDSDIDLLLGYTKMVILV